MLNLTKPAISSVSVADLLEKDSTGSKAMDGAQLCGHLVFHIQAIMLAAEEHALIGTKLNTSQPFHDAYTRLSLTIRDAGARALRFLKGGKFWSLSIRPRPRSWRGL